jgi:cation diffusion facilitator CzcD-associated flavoprotein CzcO
MTGSVAVIGAGPGGLAAVRWLLAQGFEPTIFDPVRP